MVSTCLDFRDGTLLCVPWKWYANYSCHRLTLDVLAYCIRVSLIRNSSSSLEWNYANDEHNSWYIFWIVWLQSWCEVVRRCRWIIVRLRNVKHSKLGVYDNFNYTHFVIVVGGRGGRIVVVVAGSAESWHAWRLIASWSITQHTHTHTHLHLHIYSTYTQFA